MADEVTISLSPLEAKMLWLAADAGFSDALVGLGDDCIEAGYAAVLKVYRAYRGMPPERAA